MIKVDLKEMDYYCAVSCTRGPSAFLLHNRQFTDFVGSLHLTNKEKIPFGMCTIVYFTTVMCLTHSHDVFLHLVTYGGRFIFRLLLHEWLLSVFLSLSVLWSCIIVISLVVLLISDGIIIMCIKFTRAKERHQIVMDFRTLGEVTCMLVCCKMVLHRHYLYLFVGRVYEHFMCSVGIIFQQSFQLKY